MLFTLSDSSILESSLEFAVKCDQLICASLVDDKAASVSRHTVTLKAYFSEGGGVGGLYALRLGLSCLVSPAAAQLLDNCR